MFNFLRSTIMSKIVVAVTGAMMAGFIVSHTLGNDLIFLGRDAINTYAASLQELGNVLWVARGGLIVAVLLHIVATINLSMRNKSAKPIDYKVKDYQSSTFASRSMLYAGVTILLFLIYHLLHFTFGVTNPADYAVHDSLGRHDVYGMIVLGFRNPILVIVYLLGVTALGLHLKHGVQSMFHTLGFNGQKFSTMTRKISSMFALFIVLALAAIPLSIVFKLIGGEV